MAPDKTDAVFKSKQMESAVYFGNRAFFLCLFLKQSFPRI